MSVTAQYVLYKHELEPIVKIGDYVKLFLGTRGAVYGKVVYIEPLQPRVKNLGPLDAASTGTWPMPGPSIKLNEMALGGREWGQWRLVVLDDFLLNVNVPGAMPKWQTRDAQTPESLLDSAIGRDQLVELYTYTDEFIPTVQPLNPLFESQPLARILFYGYRYVIEPVRNEPEKYTVIPVGGYPVTSKESVPGVS